MFCHNNDGNSPIMVEEIKINEGIEWINYKAFANFEKLKNVSFPKSVKTIGINVFVGCTELKEVTIPDTCEYFSDSFPEGCIVNGGKLIN